MGTSRKTSDPSQASPVAVVDGSPALDLASSLIPHPVRVGTAQIVAWMSRPADKALLAAYKAEAAVQEFRRNEQVFEPGDSTAWASLYDAAVQRLQSVSQDGEVSDISKPPTSLKFRTAVVQEFVSSLRRDSESAEGDPVAALYDDDVRFEKVVYCPDPLDGLPGSPGVVRLVGKAVFREMTQASQRIYERATKTRSFKTGESRRPIEIDVEKIAAICDSDLIAIEGGFCLGGQPCAKSNRGEWISRIPLFDKFQLASLRHAEVARGN